MQAAAMGDEIPCHPLKAPTSPLPCAAGGGRLNHELGKKTLVSFDPAFGDSFYQKSEGAFWGVHRFVHEYSMYGLQGAKRSDTLSLHTLEKLAMIGEWPVCTFHCTP